MATLFNAKLFKAAAALPSEAENTAALASPQFDPSRFPVLTFPTFSVSGATVAVSPESSFRFLKQAIDAAQSTLLLYIYDASAAYLFDLLAAAKARGVKIRAMYDGMSKGPAELAELKKVGKVKAAPSSGTRNVFTVCHQKFLVIDGRTVIVESANWAKSSVPQIPVVGGFKKANREWFIRFDHQPLAEWFANLFEKDFEIEDDASAAPTTAAPAPAGFSVLASVEPPAKLFDVEVLTDAAATVVPIVSPDNYLSAVKALLKSATKSIYLQHQYVLAGAGVKELLQVLARKREDNPQFDLRVISSATFPENWVKTQATLEAAGLKNTLKAISPKSFLHCHNKGVIVDGTAVLVSSTNWSENSILRAREAGVLVRSATIAKYYTEVFLLDWKEGLRPADIAQQMTDFHGSDGV